jgi:hypothetical protein
MLDYSFPYYVCSKCGKKPYDPYGVWTLLKMVLMPINVNRYRLLN